MNDKKLRNRLIRLAKANPALREELMPLITPTDKKAARLKKNPDGSKFHTHVTEFFSALGKADTIISKVRGRFLENSRKDIYTQTELDAVEEFVDRREADQNSTWDEFGSYLYDSKSRLKKQ
jgi:hypothetical protein